MNLCTSLSLLYPSIYLLTIMAPNHQCLLALGRPLDSFCLPRANYPSARILRHFPNNSGTNMVQGGPPDTGHQYGPQLQQEPVTSTQTLAALGSWTQTWPSAAALAWMTLWPQVIVQDTQIPMSLGQGGPRCPHGHRCSDRFSYISFFI